MDKKFWNIRSLKNKDTGYSDISIRCYDQLMRMKCLDVILDKHLKQRLEKHMLFDFGCGSGEFSNYFSNRFSEIFAYDISESIIKEARERNKDKRNIHFSSEMNFTQTKADCYFSITVLQHILDDNELIETLNKICSISSKDSIFICLESTINENYAIQQLDYLKLRRIDEYENIFNSIGFELIKIYPFYNPYLIKTHSFKKYIKETFFYSLLYKICKKIGLKGYFLQSFFFRKANKILSDSLNIDGLLTTDSFSNFLVFQKKSEKKQM